MFLCCRSAPTRARLALLAFAFVALFATGSCHLSHGGSRGHSHHSHHPHHAGHVGASVIGSTIKEAAKGISVNLGNAAERGINMLVNGGSSSHHGGSGHADHGYSSHHDSSHERSHYGDSHHGGDLNVHIGEDCRGAYDSYGAHGGHNGYGCGHGGGHGAVGYGGSGASHGATHGYGAHGSTHGYDAHSSTHGYGAHGSTHGHGATHLAHAAHGYHGATSTFADAYQGIVNPMRTKKEYKKALLSKLPFRLGHLFYDKQQYVLNRAKKEQKHLLGESYSDYIKVHSGLPEMRIDGVTGAKLLVTPDLIEKGAEVERHAKLARAYDSLIKTV